MLYVRYLECSNPYCAVLTNSNERYQSFWLPDIHLMQFDRVWSAVLTDLISGLTLQNLDVLSTTFREAINHALRNCTLEIFLGDSANKGFETTKRLQRIV